MVYISNIMGDFNTTRKDSLNMNLVKSNISEVDYFEKCCDNRKHTRDWFLYGQGILESWM